MERSESKPGMLGGVGVGVGMRRQVMKGGSTFAAPASSEPVLSFRSPDT